MKTKETGSCIEVNTHSNLSSVLAFMKKYGIAPTLLFIGVIFLIFEFWPFVKQEIWPMIKSHVEENRAIRQRQTEILEKIQKQIDELLELKRIESNNLRNKKTYLERYLVPKIRKFFVQASTNDSTVFRGER